MTLPRLLLIPALLFSLAAPAADRATVDAAMDLLEAMDMRTTLAVTIERATDAEIEKNPALGPFRGVFLEFMNKHMGYDNVKADWATLYADTFTKDELKTLAAFYRTPVGQKSMKKVPELMIKGGQYGEKKVQDNLEELKQMIATESRRIQELQAR